MERALIWLSFGWSGATISTPFRRPSHRRTPHIKECLVIVDMNGFYDIIANHIFERVINRQVLETEEFKT